MIVAAIVAIPFVWTLFLSFQHPTAIVAGRVSVVDVTFDNYRTILDPGSRYCAWLVNSIRNAASMTAIVAALAVPAGFGAVLARARAVRAIGWSALLVYLLPPVMIVIPLALVLRTLGVESPFLRVLLGQVAFALPLGFWLSVAAFRSIERGAIESATLDGATPWSMMFHVGIPAAAPALVAVFVLVWAVSWSDFLFASSLGFGDSGKTLPVGLNELYQASAVDWGVLMAACVVATLPSALLLLFAGRTLMDRWRA